MNIYDLETPSLIINQDTIFDNIEFMQDFANKNSVTLRPHCKTHKMPELAKLQLDYGAKGIAVAKLGEAEVMINYGLDDIHIANEIVAREKLEKIKYYQELGKDISFGLDSIDQAKIVEKVFEKSNYKGQVLIEIEVGEERSGVVKEEDFIDLLKFIKSSCPNIYVRGVFSHDGHSYGAEDLEDLAEISRKAQERTIKFANIGRDLDFPMDIVSIGSTPSLLNDLPILDGITEIRPGTYIFMDGSMANACKHNRVGATVLATVISKPTDERIILDVGAKGLTKQSRTKGITKVEGMGQILEYPGASIYDVYDEHAIIYNREMNEKVKIGKKIRIIPVHICPVVNLHEYAYFESNGEIVDKISIKARGKLR